MRRGRRRRGGHGRLRRWRPVRLRRKRVLLRRKRRRRLRVLLRRRHLLGPFVPLRLRKLGVVLGATGCRHLMPQPMHAAAPDPERTVGAAAAAHRRCAAAPVLTKHHKVVGLRDVVAQAVVLCTEGHELGRGAVVAELVRLPMLVREHRVKHAPAVARPLARLVHVEVQHAQRRDLRVGRIWTLAHEELPAADAEDAADRRWPVRDRRAAHGHDQPVVAAAEADPGRDRLLETLRASGALAHLVDGLAEALARATRVLGQPLAVRGREDVYTRRESRPRDVSRLHSAVCESAR